MNIVRQIGHKTLRRSATVRTISTMQRTTHRRMVIKPLHVTHRPVRTIATMSKINKIGVNGRVNPLNRIQKRHMTSFVFDLLIINRLNIY